jgi:hypothetical protein
MIGLFLAKPLGAKNLMQRLFDVMTEISKTEKHLKTLKKHIDDKDIVETINVWVGKHYEPQPVSEDEDIAEASAQVMKKALAPVLCDPTNKKIVLAQTDLDAMQEQKLKICFEYYFVRMRLKDKESFVESLGDSEMIEMVKTIVPSLYQPLVAVYSKAVWDFYYRITILGTSYNGG